MSLRTRLKPISKRWCPVYAAVLAAISIVTTLGWLLERPGFTTLGIGSTQTALSSAACVGLCALALVLPSLTKKFWVRTLKKVIGGAVAATACIASVESFSPGLIATVLRLSSSMQFSVRMNPTSIVGFLAAGFVIILVANGWNGKVGKTTVQVCTALVGAVGIVGLLSYVINLDYLYVTAYSKQISFPAALAFLTLALGLWCTWRSALWNSWEEVDVEPSDIYRTTDIMISVIVATAALVAFGLSQGRTTDLMAKQMTLLNQARRSFFENSLQGHLGKALQASSRPAIIADVRTLGQKQAGDDKPIRERLDASAKSFLGFGFSAFAYRGSNGENLSSDGVFLTSPEQRIPIRGMPDTELLYKDGYFFRSRVPMVDSDGVAGYIISEQPAPELTKLHREAMKFGETGDMVVCGLRGPKQVCFPLRWRPKSASYPAYINGQALPLTRAVNGETATDVTNDFRRQRVMAALGPIGQTGLGMATKMDMWELYAPIRTQFLLALPFLGVLVGGSIWVMRRRLAPLLKSLEASRLELQHRAMHDTLTGLPNRLMFNDRLEQSMHRAMRSKKMMALMFLDLDHFKQINDTFGHNMGDAVLQWSAQQLKKGVRASDTVARLGGDEFTIILENLSCEKDAEMIAKSIQIFVTEPNAILPENGKVGASIGIAFYYGSDMTAENLIQTADAALYECKQAGRGKFKCVFRPT